MSQQYYYNSAQYTTPTSYAGQSVNACYAAAVAQPLTTGYTTTTGRVTIGTAYNVSGTQMSSAHRSQAPVTYTYPTNATVMASPLAVVPGQQTTLMAPQHPATKLGATGTSFVIANGPTSAQTNLANNGAYTVTTSYFQQIPGQPQVQQQTIAQAAAVAAAQQVNFQAAVAAANSNRERSRNFFDPRFQNFRKGTKPTQRSSIDSQVFYCEVCKISCAGPQTYKEHLDGQKHKKKGAGNNVITNLPNKSNQRQLRCELCDVTCTGVDAYQAHIRGSKHQKTLKLHQRLGKPIPCADPLVMRTNPGTDSNTELNVSNVKIATIPKINFISTTTLKSILHESSLNEKTSSGNQEVKDSSQQEEHVDLNSLQEKAIPAVGNEYIEITKNDGGKVIQFFCKLCSCKFNDPHAKEMHLKGRRHRLQYKKKVDPSLVVDIKSGTNRNWKLEEDRMRHKQQREEFWRRRDMQTRMREMQRLEYSNIACGNNYRGMGMRETLDDRLLMAKHASIYPTDDEVHNLQSMVLGCEKALRHISEQLLDDNPDVDDDEKDIDDGDEDKKKNQKKKEAILPDKLLSGAMRVGPLAKGLLLRGELVVSLVLLCAKWPTFSLMNMVLDKLPGELQELLPHDNIEVTLNTDYQCILVTRKKEPEIHCYIHFTSSIVREEGLDGSVPEQPEDGLERQRCLDALASLRHTKWFQAKVAGHQECLVLVRVLRDLCQRVPTWSPLSSWAVELLVEKAVSSDPASLSPGGALRRFLEVVASGVLLPGNPGLRDPCEKEARDAAAVLSEQEREDITASAQHALRLVAFRRTHAVLDMEAPAAAGERKRRHSGEVVAKVTEGPKKERKEEGEGESPSS